MEKNTSGASPDLRVISEPEPTLKEVLSAVNSCKGSLSDLCNQLRGLKEELRSMSQELQKVAERTSILEERLSQVEDVLHPIRQEFKIMQTQLDVHKFKMDKMENRLHRSNVRVMGLPERSEGSCPEAFMEKWLREVFGTETFSHLFAIERAHRIPIRSAKSGGHPRPMIVKLLNYKDKVVLMQKSREKGDIFYNGTRISLYPDYSPDLQKKKGRTRGYQAQPADSQNSIHAVISSASACGGSRDNSFF